MSSDSTDNFNDIDAVREMARVIAELVYKKDTSDHSFKAKIVSVANSKKYEVLYSGNIYTVSSSTVCEVGDFVWVCAPCNNWNNLFVVCKV